MKWGKDQTVSVRTILAPGDVKKRQATPEVIELAETIHEFGDQVINPPTVIKARVGWQLIAGRDRVAALLLASIRKTPVRVVAEATPQELHDIEVVENLNRRVDDRNKLIAERVRKVAQRIVAERATSVTNVTEVGRPKTPEGEARERVAAQLGTTPAAIKQAEHREKVRSEATAPTSEGAPAEPPPVETFGHELPPHVCAHVVPVLAVLANIDQACRKARAAHRDLGITDFERSAQGRIGDAIGQLEAVVASVRPTHLCPYCLGRNGEGAAYCKVCNVNGYVTRSVFESAPSEKRGPAAETAKVAPRSKPKKRGGIQFEDGPVRPVEEVAAELGMTDQGDVDESDVPF